MSGILAPSDWEFVSRTRTSSPYEERVYVGEGYPIDPVTLLQDTSKDKVPKYRTIIKVRESESFTRRRIVVGTEIDTPSFSPQVFSISNAEPKPASLSATSGGRTFVFQGDRIYLVERSAVGEPSCGWAVETETWMSLPEEQPAEPL